MHGISVIVAVLIALDFVTPCWAETIVGEHREVELSDANYIPDLTKRLERQWRLSHRQQSTPMQAVIFFIVDYFGHLSHVRVAVTSGSDSFDQQATRAVCEAGKFCSARLPEDANEQLSVQATFSDISSTTKSAVTVEILEVGGALSMNTANSAAVEEKSLPEAVRLNNEGVKALNNNDFRTSFNKLQAAVAADPTFRLARQNLAIAHNNYGLQIRRNLAEALRQFHQAFDIDPSNVTTVQNMNGVILMMGKNPNSFDDRIKLAEEAKTNSDLVGEVIEYRAALKLKNDPATHKKLGDVFRLLNDKDKASAEYAAAYREAK